jgi:hypothetical protein
MLKYIPALAIPLFLLGGCVSDEQLLAQDRQGCANYGFAPGSNAFAQCMQNASMHRDQMRQQQRAIDADQDAQAAALRAQNNYNNRPPAYRPQPRPLQSDPPPFVDNRPRPTPQADPDADGVTTAPFVDQRPNNLPSGAAQPGMQCSGDGDDQKCDAQ